MAIAGFFVIVFGIYLLLKRRRGEPLSSETQELGGRIGRSVQGALPLPGLTGQPGAHMLPARGPDEIGPEDQHILVMKGPEDRPDEPANDMSSDEVRARLDAILPLPPPPPPRRRRRR